MSQSEEVHDAKYGNSYEQRRLSVIRGLIPQGGGDQALDLGCGSGVISQMLTAAGWSVTAVDLHPDNVQRTAPRVTRAIQGDGLSVAKSLEGRTYGFITVLELIEHIEPRAQREELLREVLRLAKPGATLLVSTPNRMSPDGLYGYYYAQLMRGIPYKAWDETHGYIYSSFGVLAALKRAGWKPATVVGYFYRGRISLPLEASRTFPLNRFGFNTIVLSRPAADQS
jgi:2-polyprenyl-3-methyl-5-hydroxy-6-metoxy-1,4-benzoquinol methylase